MKKELSENELRYKAEAYCSLTEHCISEVQDKLEGWGAAPEAAGRIIAHLLEEKYIDEQRFCKAFVRDKYRFNGWGRNKIVQALRLKHLPGEVIALGLEEIDEEEYRSILAGLIAQKNRSVKARNDYERNGKLVRFAISRGFEMEVILPCVKQTDADDVCLD